MCPCSRFHPNQARGELGHERRHLCPPQPFPHCHLAFCGDTLELKHLFGDIEPNDGDLPENVLLFASPLILVSFCPPLGV